MSRGTPQFGQIRPSPVRSPAAISEEGEIGAIARTVFEAFGAGTVGARAVTAETVREARVETAEDQVAIAQQAAIQDEASRMRTRVLLENKELEREFDQNADLEFFGIQELFARGDDQTKRDFLAKHQWADPRNQSRIESFYGRQLATTDWFRAQQQIQDFYTNEANEGRSLRVTELMADFLEERQDLPAGAALAYQQQFMGQVGNFIFRQESARANARSKEVRKQRDRNNLAQAGLYFMGNAELEDFTRVVTDGIELVEGEEGLGRLTDHMAQSAGEALAKLIGVIPNSDLDQRIAALPEAVRESSQIKIMQARMVLAQRQADQKAITQEAADIKALSTRLFDGKQLPELEMLVPRAADIPGSAGEQTRAILDSRITQLRAEENFQSELVDSGANVTIHDISAIPGDLSWAQRNWRRAAATLREVAETDREKAFSLTADVETGALGDMFIRAKNQQEVSELANLLDRPQARNLMGAIIERKNKFIEKSAILGSLAAGAPTDMLVDRYGDRFARHMLDIQTRDIDPITDEKKAAQAAGELVKRDLETDFVTLRSPLGIKIYARADMMGVGNVRKREKDADRRLSGALSDLSKEGRQLGDVSPNLGLAFEHGGKTYIPATGNGRVGLFLEWDKNTTAVADSRILGRESKLFGDLEEKLLETATETDLVFNSDVRWREAYGTRFVWEFDQTYFAEEPNGGIGAWVRDEARQRWFDQTGFFPDLNLDGLEGRALTEVQLQRDIFSTFMNLIAIEHGWSGLNRTDAPAGFAKASEFLSGLGVGERAVQEEREPSVLEQTQRQAVVP